MVFTAASAAAAVADSGGTLIAARTVQGVGAALVIPASLAVVAVDLPARRRSMAVGLWTAALAVALALGPVVGGIRHPTVGLGLGVRAERPLRDASLCC